MDAGRKRRKERIEGLRIAIAVIESGSTPTAAVV
jgi:hypothetical protein